MSFKNVRIVDLDGTLINSEHRYQTKHGKIDLEHWIENEHKAMDDTLLPLAEKVREWLQDASEYVIFATARACTKNDITYKFLDHHGLKPDLFIHRRGRKDTRGGAELKIEAIKPILDYALNNVKVHVYEDNKIYLDKMCKVFSAVPHFIKSKQGY